jgi:large subunit ribosomal protein L18
MSKNKNKQPIRIKRLSTNRLRLSVFKSNLHIYAQIIDDKLNKTLFSSSSLKLTNAKGKEQAKIVGKDIATKALAGQASLVYLDRGHKRYDGCLMVLCESARENGLVF